MNLINTRAMYGGAEAPEGLGNEGAAGSVLTSSGVGRTDVDQLVWFAQSALHDLCAALADRSKVPVITEMQLGDLNRLVAQAQRAKTLGNHIDLPPHEFNRS